ncbi:MAG TPA: hypothetical protein DCS93_25145 [Microscillaceae bacterium]|nr:hypothetical protein [Microscillaceae bacterium]
MNTYLIIANILTGLAFLAHTFQGDKELEVIGIKNQEDNWANKQEKWTMARCGWHWVSFDLLMATVGLSVINFTDWITQELLLVKLLSVYFAGYAVFWIITLLISQSFPKKYLKLGQWILLLVISGLLYLGLG